jgi:hypothetical protein
MEAQVMFNIKGDLKPITKHLTKVQKKQIPFASAAAINETLKQVVKAEQMQITKRLDRPTPFTVKAFKIRYAKKHALHGEVIIKPAQWKYLKYQIEGGTRTGKIGVPTANAKLNKYGNLPGRRKGLIRGKKQYMNDKGVWERSGGKKNPRSKLVVAFASSVTYTKRFPFYKIADGVARSQFQKNFQRSIKRAIASAR